MKNPMIALVALATLTSLAQTPPVKDVLRCPSGHDYLKAPGVKNCSICGQVLRVDAKATAALYYKTFFSSGKKQAGERWPETRTKQLSTKDLEPWSDKDLLDAIREIRARHCSREDRLRGCEWYRPLLTRKEADRLRTPIEKKNYTTLSAEVRRRIEEKAFVTVKVCSSGNYLATPDCPPSEVTEKRMRKSDVPKVPCIKHRKSNTGG